MPKLQFTLSYDGFGLNLTSEKYSPRIATFERGISAVEQAEWEKIGKILEQAPMMLLALERIVQSAPLVGLPLALERDIQDATIILKKVKGL